MRCQIRDTAPAGQIGCPGIRLVVPALALLLGLSSHSLWAQTGGASYDCQVQTQLGVHGLVMVQADDAETARRVAQGSVSLTTDKREARSVSVIQCVRRGEERFSDLSFRRFAENLPR